MSLSRRDFLKNSAAVAAAGAVGIAVPQEAQAAAAKAESTWRWDKAACRFCGTGLRDNACNYRGTYCRR